MKWTPSRGVSITRKSIEPRRSDSASHEEGWYASPAGRQQTGREFARSVREGTLSQSAGLRIPETDPKVLQKLMERAKENATRPISIRLSIAELDRAKRIAEKTGVGYQTVRRCQVNCVNSL